MGTHSKATKAENNFVARLARHAIAKSPLDISELNISCIGGQIQLTGKVKAPRGYTSDMSVRKEFENLQNMIRASRGVKDVSGDRVQMS